MRHIGKLALLAASAASAGGFAFFASGRIASAASGVGRGTCANPLPHASSGAAMAQVPIVAAQMRALWPSMVGGTMSEAAVEIAIAQFMLESGIGTWWKDKTGEGKGNMVGSHNLGARQCGVNDEGGSDYTCVEYGDSRPNPDGTQTYFPAKFRYYNSLEAGIKDALYSITHQWPAVAELQSGDVLGYAIKQGPKYHSDDKPNQKVFGREYKGGNGYYGGFGATMQERVGGYGRAIASHLPAIAAALGHTKIAACIAPELTTAGAAHASTAGVDMGAAYTALHTAGLLPRARVIPGTNGTEIVWYLEPPVLGACCGEAEPVRNPFCGCVSCLDMSGPHVHAVCPDASKEPSIEGGCCGGPEPEDIAEVNDTVAAIQAGEEVDMVTAYIDIEGPASTVAIAIVGAALATAAGIGVEKLLKKDDSAKHVIGALRNAGFDVIEPKGKARKGWVEVQPDSSPKLLAALDFLGDKRDAVLREMAAKGIRFQSQIKVRFPKAMVAAAKHSPPALDEDRGSIAALRAIPGVTVSTPALDDDRGSLANLPKTEPVLTRDEMVAMFPNYTPAQIDDAMKEHGTPVQGLDGFFGGFTTGLGVVAALAVAAAATGAIDAGTKAVDSVRSLKAAGLEVVKPGEPVKPGWSVVGQNDPRLLAALEFLGTLREPIVKSLTERGWRVAVKDSVNVEGAGKVVAITAGVVVSAIAALAIVGAVTQEQIETKATEVVGALRAAGLEPLEAGAKPKEGWIVVPPDDKRVQSALAFLGKDKDRFVRLFTGTGGGFQAKSVAVSGEGDVTPEHAAATDAYMTSVSGVGTVAAVVAGGLAAGVLAAVALKKGAESSAPPPAPAPTPAPIVAAPIPAPAPPPKKPTPAQQEVQTASANLAKLKDDLARLLATIPPDNDAVNRKLAEVKEAEMRVAMAPVAGVSAMTEDVRRATEEFSIEGARTVAAAAGLLAAGAAIGAGVALAVNPEKAKENARNFFAGKQSIEGGACGVEPVRSDFAEGQEGDNAYLEHRIAWQNCELDRRERREERLESELATSPQVVTRFVPVAARRPMPSRPRAPRIFGTDVGDVHVAPGVDVTESEELETVADVVMPGAGVTAEVMKQLNTPPHKRRPNRFQKVMKAFGFNVGEIPEPVWGLGAKDGPDDIDKAVATGSDVADAAGGLLQLVSAGKRIAERQATVPDPECRKKVKAFVEKHPIIARWFASDLRQLAGIEQESFADRYADELFRQRGVGLSGESYCALPTPEEDKAVLASLGLSQQEEDAVYTAASRTAATALDLYAPGAGGRAAEASDAISAFITGRQMAPHAAPAKKPAHAAGPSKQAITEAALRAERAKVQAFATWMREHPFRAKFVAKDIRNISGPNAPDIGAATSGEWQYYACIDGKSKQVGPPVPDSVIDVTDVAIATAYRLRVDAKPCFALVSGRAWRVKIIDDTPDFSTVVVIVS